MKIFTDIHSPEIVTMLRQGKIGVLRTDTLYGIVADANNESAVTRVYVTKGRNETKSPIVLVANRADLLDPLSVVEEKLLDELWPGKVSVILPSHRAPAWITRGNGSVAYRLPDDNSLCELLARTGPLIAPSANPEGLPPAKTIDQARTYFGDTVDFYVDSGEVTDDAPSQLVRCLSDGSMERLR